MKERTSSDFFEYVDEVLENVDSSIIKEWQSHVLTQAFYNFARGTRLRLMEEWASDAYLEENANIRATGIVTGISNCLEFGDFVQELVRQREIKESGSDSDSDGVQTGY